MPINEVLIYNIMSRFIRGIFILFSYQRITNARYIYVDTSGIYLCYHVIFYLQMFVSLVT